MKPRTAVVITVELVLGFAAVALGAYRHSGAWSCVGGALLGQAITFGYVVGSLLPRTVQQARRLR